MKKTIFCLIISLFFFATACKEKETETDKALLISSKTWKITAYTVYPPMDPYEDGNYTTDLYEAAYFNDCLKNASHTFAADGTYTIDYDCEYADQYYTWELSGDQSQINYYGILSDILILNDTIFQFRTPEERYPYYTYTFKAK